MEIVIKTFMGLFFLLLVYISGIQCINALNEAENARDFKDMTIADIEDSDFDAAVINELTQAAKKKGYELVVNVRDSKAGTQAISIGNKANLQNMQDVCSADISLKYSFELPFFGSSTEHVLHGIAR